MSITNEKQRVKQAILDKKIKDDTTLKIFLMVEELKDKIDEEIPALNNLLKRVRGEDGKDGKSIKGEKGDSVKGEKGKSGKDGKDGKSGRDGKDGQNGRDAEPVDTDKIAREATESVSKQLLPKIPTITQIEQNIPQLGKSIRDGLELLQDKDKLDVSAIKGLDKMENAILMRATSILDQRTKFLINKKAVAATTTDFVDDETPTGAVNGANKVFTLANTPISGSVKVFVNGQRMKGGGEDYTLSGATITFETAPPTNSIILVDYRK